MEEKLYNVEKRIANTMTNLSGIVALRMTTVQIPQHVVLNETVRMQCNFNLDKEPLYSVKWYKDGHEFYRYVPRDVPTVQTFRVPGVNVNVSRPKTGIQITSI